MFFRAKVIYIVKELAGDYDRIIQDLNSLNILEDFFPGFNEGFSYKRFVSSLPSNTILCSLESNNSEFVETKKNNVAIPFISSHISTPIKIGETIWFYKYSYDNLDGYYLGRVHSLLNTEDTSYTFSDREFYLTSKDHIKSIKSNKKGITGRLESIDNFNKTSDVLFKPVLNQHKTLKKINNYYQNEIRSLDLKPSTSVYFSAEDTVLQGSYNNFINLTSSKKSKNKSKIEIVAGADERKKSFNYITEIVIENCDVNEKRSADLVEVHIYKDLSPVVTNEIFAERIKSTNSFFNPENVSDDIASNIDNVSKRESFDDSSSFIVSESGENNFSVLEKFKERIPVISSDLNTFSNTSIQIDVNNAEKTYVTKNNKSSAPLVPSLLKDLPSITAISDSITFCLHQNSPGSLTLINPNSPDNIPSQINVNNLGQINLDSQKVIVGDNARSLEDTQVFLSFSDNMQSIVLGEQLKDFIEELLSVQKESIDLIKDLFKKSHETNENLINVLSNISSTYQNLSTVTGIISAALPPLGALSTEFTTQKQIIDVSLDTVGNSQFQSLISEFKANDNENLYKRLENIENNLEKMLSKFTKSS
jgi:hypothetical protein